MTKKICSAHGCELIVVTVSDGGKVEDCPKCMEFERELKINFGSEQPSWAEQHNAE